MNKKLMLLSVVFCFLLFPLQAGAVYIVDTGAPNNNYSKWVLDATNWLAAEFTIDDGYRLTAIEGYMGGGGNTIDIAIYADDGEVPDPNNELYRSNFDLQINPPDAWYGLTGLSWDLYAGTYWVAFEVRTSGSWTTMMKYSPSPLGNEAGNCSGGTESWIPADYLNLGVRIQGDSISTVPEPASMLLLGTGLIGLVGIGRKKLLKK